MHRIFVLFGLLALVLSSFHAGPVGAHGIDFDDRGKFVSHGHTHALQDDEDRNSETDGSVSLDADQNHNHYPSGPPPQLPQADDGNDFGKQLVFASEASLLHSGSPAPPLDPPIA